MRIGPEAAEAALAERQAVLRRTLRGLPDEMLRALADGLERYGDQLVTGRLYRSARGGGCAVGVMLRELEPEGYSMGRVRFWAHHGWRRKARSYGSHGAPSPRLRHLEWSFDDAVELTRRVPGGGDRRAATRSVGTWMTEAARQELAWRSIGDSATRPVAEPAHCR
jgi:hypothetical protein